MSAIDVLPAALSGAAGATRSFARSAQPVQLGAAVLAGALEHFTSCWTEAVLALADDAERTAADLQQAAEGYAQVEALLVPR